MGVRLMCPRDIRAARRRIKGEIVEKSRKKELKKLAAQWQRDAFEKSLPMDRAAICVPRRGLGASRLRRYA